VFHRHGGGGCAGVLHNFSCRGLGPETGCYHIEQGKYSCQYGCYHQSPSSQPRRKFKAGITPPKKVHKLIKLCNSVRQNFLNIIEKNEELKRLRKKAKPSEKEKYQKQINLLEAKIGKFRTRVNEIRTKINIAIVDEYRPKDRRKRKKAKSKRV